MTRGVGLGVLLVLAASCGSSSDAFVVHAAASLSEVAPALVEALVADEERPGLNLAGSPTLVTQVREGAPAGVLLVADEASLEPLVGGGQVSAVVAVATNQLRLVVPVGNPGGIDSLDDLGRADLAVGLCAETVPCGRLATAELDDAGITPRPDTEEPDVRSLLAKVAGGELDAGLVYATDARAAGRDVEVVADRRLDRVTTYFAAVVGHEAPDAAGDLVAAIAGPRGRGILASFGFGPP